MRKNSTEGDGVPSTPFSLRIPEITENEINDYIYSEVKKMKSYSEFIKKIKANQKCLFDDALFAASVSANPEIITEIVRYIQIMPSKYRITINTPLLSTRLFLDKIIASHHIWGKRSYNMCTLSIHLNKEEEAMWKDASKKYNCSIPMLIKRLAEERLEDEHDIKVFEEFHRNLADGKEKIISHDEFWKGLGFDVQN